MNRVPTCATLAKETSSDVFRLVLHFSKRSPFLIFPLWVIYMWNQGRQEYSPLITLHPQFSKLVFACFCFWLFKEFLTLLSRSVVYACDLRTEGCASRLVFNQTMKHGVFMHTSLLAAAYVFTLDLTLLLLTPTSLLSALIPPYLSFYPLFPPGMWLMLHRLFVHTAQVSLRIDGSVFLGSSGSGERQREPWSCLTGTKPEEEKR